MSDLTPSVCPFCRNSKFITVFEYQNPPNGEIHFKFSDKDYHRTLSCCKTCGHFFSLHNMDMSALYKDEYVESTYGGIEGIRKNFERIIRLDPAESDNHGRVKRIVEFMSDHLSMQLEGESKPTVLDVGSGLSVFLFEMKSAGWDCTALDPDARNVQHAREVVGIKSIEHDFMTAEDLGRFDLVTFNKVLEHIPDPVKMLEKSKKNVRENGIVYVELPDGEAAISEGAGREEFFIEHYHAFSMSSAALLARCAGFTPLLIERLREPSGKFTLRVFCS